MDPEASRPKIPEGYGVPTDVDGLLPWSYVDERMDAAPHYWLSTTGPSGAPHTRPIDGMWLDRRLYFGGDPDARWQRNLTENSRASINLEAAEQAVILEGRVGIARPDTSLANRLAEASNRKYAMNQTPEDYEGVAIGEFVPIVAFAWKVLYEDATRWRFA